MDSGLSINGISKSYGKVHALSDVSFDVRPGELFGFVGSNGAGKTTAMRIALGVLSADAGTVTINGERITSEMRSRIGYMPADRGLYPKMKVGEQLTYFARLHGLSASEAADSVQRWAERVGVDHRIDDTVDTLSTGNQQRVQLAAALVHDPSVLVLDEPFSGLDPIAVDVMSAVLVEKVKEGVPVIFSSHQLELVESLCDRVGILAHGSLVAVGTVTELRSHQAPRLEVLSDAAPPGWADHLPGVYTVSSTHGRHILELAAESNDQDILAAALDHGAVHGFTRTTVPLAELYREAVA